MMITPTKIFSVYPADAALMLSITGVEDFLEIPFVYADVSNALSFTLDSMWVNNLRPEDSYSSEELEFADLGIHPVFVHLLSDEQAFDELKNEWTDKFFVGEVQFLNWGLADPVVGVGTTPEGVDADEGLVLDPEFQLLKIAAFTNAAVNATETFFAVFQLLPSDLQRERMQNGNFKYDRLHRAKLRTAG